MYSVVETLIFSLLLPIQSFTGRQIPCNCWWPSYSSWWHGLKDSWQWIFNWTIIPPNIMQNDNFAFNDFKHAISFQDSIQKIVLALSKRVTQSKTEREKVRMLCAYRLIVLLLLDDLQNGLGMNWAYFIRDVIHRCCHWLTWHLRNGVDDAVFVCVIQILQRVTEACVAACSQVCCILLMMNSLLACSFCKRLWLSMQWFWPGEVL